MQNILLGSQDILVRDVRHPFELLRCKTSVACVPRLDNIKLDVSQYMICLKTQRPNDDSGGFNFSDKEKVEDSEK